MTKLEKQWQYTTGAYKNILGLQSVENVSKNAPYGKTGKVDTKSSDSESDVSSGLQKSFFQIKWFTENTVPPVQKSHFPTRSALHLEIARLGLHSRVIFW